MARQAQNQASQNVTAAQGAASTAGTNAQDVFGQLLPLETNQYNNPQGFGPQGVNAMKTGAGQVAAAGGAAARENLRLQAERTGNAGGFAPAEDQAARDAESAAGQANTGIDVANAQAKLGQQQQANQALQGLFGQNLGAQTSNLNAANQGVDAETGAGTQGWYQNLLNGIATVSGGGQAAGQAYKNFGGG